jgi:hypothetical protein
MIQVLRLIIYLVVLAAAAVAGYTILKAGDPDNLLRPFIDNPERDMYAAAAAGAVIFAMMFVLNFLRDRETYRFLVENHLEYIRSERKKGRGDAQIAESILQSVGSKPGRRHDFAKKKMTEHMARYR